MKRTLIGAVLLLVGLLDIIGIFVTAAISLPEYAGWSLDYPSRLWFLIFAGKPPIRNGFSSGAGGLGLGLFFVLGIIFVILGLIIMAKEYFESKDRTVTGT